MAAAIFGVLALACYIACYKLTTERIVAPENGKSEKVSISKTIKGLVKNKPLMWILARLINFHDQYDACSTVNLIYLKIILANTAALSISGLLKRLLLLLRFHS